ncbi:MAG: hypothetical protein FWD98_05960 [Defluviitaleaceae bacterium]|nr:hypothetical protein [Defluviitaleaceae bacterium]
MPNRRKAAPTIILFFVFAAVCAVGAVKFFNTEPRFPAWEDVVADKLGEAGLEWTASQIDSDSGLSEVRGEWRRNISRLYSGYSAAGYLSDTVWHGGRSVSITFLGYFGDSPYMDVYNPGTQDMEAVIVFTTLLFAGFDDKYEVARYFRGEADSLAWQPTGRSAVIPHGRFVEAALWEREINGAFIRIVVGRPSGGDDKYMGSIIISDVAEAS